LLKLLVKIDDTQKMALFFHGTGTGWALASTLVKIPARDASEFSRASRPLGRISKLLDDTLRIGIVPTAATLAGSHRGTRCR
jgi:hypothetical protein